MLNKVEIATVEKILRTIQPGRYELRELFGDQWASVRRPRWYGAQFKRAVRAGHLPQVRWAGWKTNRHQAYEVFATRDLALAAPVVIPGLLRAAANSPSFRGRKANKNTA